MCLAGQGPQQPAPQVILKQEQFQPSQNTPQHIAQAKTTLPLQPQTSQPPTQIQPQPQVQQQTPQQQPPRMNIFQQLAQSIEACNNASSLYKSNVRTLIDTIQTDLDGPPLE